MRKLLYLLVFLFALTNIANSQTDFAIGTGTDGNATNNGTTGYPCPLQDYYEGNRSQYLWQASELTGAGMSAGFINAIKWEVVSLGTAGLIEQFQIKIGTTAASSLSGTSWEDVSTVVFAMADYQPVAGMNIFTLTTPFFWNGVDNLVIEVCNGDPGNTTGNWYTANPVVPWTTGLSFNGSHNYRVDSQGNLCGSSTTTNSGAMTTRPNITFNFTAGSACSGTPTPGTTISTSTVTCPGSPFSLSLSGTSQVTGLTYQWQSSPDGNAPWTDISGATSSSLANHTQTVTTYYRAAVSCGANTDYSTPLMVASPSLLNGTYTINNTIPTGGSNFQTFEDVLQRLICGIGGPVTFNVTAGQVFNESTELNFTTTGTSTNTITFKKDGAGANPVIRRAGTSATSDFIVKLTGVSYYTFDGIDFEQTGTGSSDYVEYGLHVVNSSSTLGSNYNTFKNGKVTLGAYSGTKGVYVQGSPTPTDFSGTNNFNRFLNMTINGGIYGYHFTGGTSTYKANGNEVNTELGGTSIVQNISSGSTNTTLYGVLAEYQTNFRISNTTIMDVAAGGTSTAYGIIMQTSATNTGEISGNTVTGVAGGGTVYGIYTSAGDSVLISGNQVNNLSTTGNASSLKGIYVTATGITSFIRGNRVWGLSSSGTTTTSVNGIEVATGIEHNIFNNIISNLTASSSTQTTGGTRGISVSGGSTGAVVKIYHNTVYLDDVSTVAGYTSAALHNSSVTPDLDIRNNIFINNSNVTTGTRAVAFWKTSTTDNILDNSNNNLYYAGTPGPKNLIHYAGTTAVETLADYKALASVAPGESASISELPTFINIAASPYDLHLNTTIATQVESGGTVVAEVTTDFDGDVRSLLTPDIGADEFNGVGADLTGPSITYTELGTKTICTSVPSISATIVDGSGVNSTAGTRPRLWFKKSSENDALPATNTSASNGWKWVEASNATSPFEFSFDFSLLTSPLAPGDSISYFIVAQDLAGTPNVGVNAATFSANPATVALGAGAFPVSGNVNGFSILTQPNPITVTISRTDLCASGTVTLGIDPNVDVTGGEYQWQSSPAGANTWTDITGATTIPYTTDNLTASTDFRLVVKCGGAPIATSPSPVVTVIVNNPQVTSSAGASRCGPGEVTLTASGAGSIINWYDSPTGGASLYNGDIFTTPVLTSTTTYYAAATSGYSTYTAGRPAPASAINLAASPRGIRFNALQPVTLESVTVFSTTATAGDGVIELRSSTGALLAGPVNVSWAGGGSTASPVPFVLPLNFNVPVGTDHRLLMVSRTGGGIAYETSNISGTWGNYSSPGGEIEIVSSMTSATGTSTTAYYYFYNWQVSSGCEGTRVPVVATINTPPLLSVGATADSICQGQNTTLSVSSSNPGYTYTWTPGGMTGTSVIVNPTETTKYYVNAVDNSAGTFNGCANIDSITIDVSQIPSPVFITPPSSAVCLGGNATALNVGGGTLDFTAIIGDGTVQNGTNTTTNMPPYGNYYSGTRHQMLVLASELTAQGMTAGSLINSLAFDVVSNTNALGYNNFTIRLANTSAASLTTTFISTGLTEVYTSPNFNPTVGWSTHDFNTPFAWDGTSNLLVETYFSNCGNATSNCTGGTTCTGAGSGVTYTQNAVTNQTSTPFVSHAYYYSDGESCNPQTVSSASTSVSMRPNMQFGFGAPTTITWSPIAGLFTDAAATTPYIAGTHATTVYAKPATATNYTVTATAGAGCNSTGTVNVAVTTPPSATIAYAGSPYCNIGTATVSLTGSTGGTYSSASGLVIDALTGDINLAGSIPGTYTVTYTILASGGCDEFSTTTSITINTAPSADINYVGSPYCTGASIAMVTQTGTPGGTYSSTPGLVIDANTGTVDVVASTLGTYTVTYTIPASGGCGVYTATAQIVITTSPAATISYESAPYCTNAGMATVTRTGSAGGTFSSTAGLSIDASTGTIDLGGSTPGTYTVTYSISSSGGCSAFSTTTSITINAAPSATISYAGSPYCAGAGTASVTHTGTTGGSYSAAPGGLSIDAATGAINLGVSAPGTYTVTYTIAPANGCVVYTTTASVTVSPLPAATIAYTGSPYCNTGGMVNVTLTGTTGGTFSSTTGLTIDATTGTIDVGTSTLGTYTVTYTIPAGNGCGIFTTTTSITIVAPAAATISYAGSPYCSNGGTASVTHTGTTGGIYTSTTGLSINPTTGDINLGASTPGTYVVTYTVAPVTGCVGFTTSTSVTITASPFATITYAGAPFCSTVATANVTRTGATGGTYSSVAGLSINPTTGQINVATSTAGTYTVSYTVTGGSGCPDFVATTSVTITQAPSATISYAGSPYCGGSGTASVTHTGTPGGTYSSTNGLSINPTTGEIDLAASAPGTYVVSYTIAASGGCATYNATGVVVIAASASATISYAGSPYCGNGGTANVNLSGTPGGTYTSTAGLSINATTGAINISGSTPGTYTVTYSIDATGPCPAFSTTTDVTITAPPAATISYAGSPYCSNAGTASVTITGTAGGVFSSTPGLVIDANSGAIDLAASNAGTYTVSYTIDASGGCDVFTASANVSISTAPAATISYAGSPYCGSAGTAVVTHSGTPGGTYSSTSGLSINAGSGAINIAASTPGTYTVTYTVPAASGCGAFTATTTVQLTAPGTWTGLANTDWNNPANWCGGIPSSATDAVIPAAAPNMPNLSNGAGAVRNISTEPGVVLTIGNAGVLEIYGSMTGGGALEAANGSLVLRGITDQQLPAFTASNLTMNMAGAGSLILGGNSAVTGNVTLTNGNVSLGSYNLSISSGVNGKLTSHFITNGSGSVMTNLAPSQNKTIPVGSDAMSYNPVALISNAGHATDNFSVRVQTGVFENGTSGSTFQTHVADRMWIINEGTAGGSNMNITLQWSSSQELPSFNRAKSYVTHYDGNGWIVGTGTQANGGDPYTQTMTGVTALGSFAVQTQPIPRPVTGIYPNPATDHLNVVTDLLSTGPVVFSIYDSKGSMVYQKQETLTLGLNQTRLDIGHLSAGVYTVRVTTRLNEKFMSQRFVKTN